MKRLAQAASLAALAATIVPPVLFFYNQTTLDVAKAWMLGAAVAWFIATPMWMDHQ